MCTHQNAIRSGASWAIIHLVLVTSAIFEGPAGLSSSSMLDNVICIHLSAKFQEKAIEIVGNLSMKKKSHATNKGQKNLQNVSDSCKPLMNLKPGLKQAKTSMSHQLYMML